MSAKPVKPFFKITFQDLEIAEEFFDNEKQFSEFILAVSYYYRSIDYQIKNKNVQKYFKTYQKTMDNIIEAKSFGKKGAEIKAENQQVTPNTLKGGIEGGLKDSLSANNKPLNINNKQESINKKPRTVFTPPTLDDVISYFKEKGYLESAAKKAFEYYSAGDWKDSKGNQVKNWKQKMLSVWFKDENKDNSPKDIPGETPEERTRRLYVERMRANPMKMTY